MPVTPIPRALPPSARWPGCATTAGWPRNSCPPRPRPPYTSTFPGYASDVRVTPQRAGTAHRATSDRGPGSRRRGVAAQQHSGHQHLRGGDGRWRGEHPPVTQQLSARLRAPVVTTPQSRFNVAAGAALVATPPRRRRDGPCGGYGHGHGPDCGGLGRGGRAGRLRVGLRRCRIVDVRALAWSQDDAPAGEPVPYAGEDYTFDRERPVRFARRWSSSHEEEGYQPEPGPLPWYKRPPILFGRPPRRCCGRRRPRGHPDQHERRHRSGDRDGDDRRTGPSPARAADTAETITVTGPDGRPSTTVVPPPPLSSTTTTTAPSSSPTTTTTTTTTTTARRDRPPPSPRRHSRPRHPRPRPSRDNTTVTTTTT